MNRKSLKRLRAAAFAAQNGLCFYCGKWMWLVDCPEFAAVNGLTLRQAGRRQCTAEHLIARKRRPRERVQHHRCLPRVQSNPPPAQVTAAAVAVESDPDPSMQCHALTGDAALLF